MIHQIKQRLEDWLDKRNPERSLLSGMKQCDERWEPRLKEAKKKARQEKDRYELDKVEHEYFFERSGWSDPLFAMRSRKLLARAAKHHIHLDEIPLAKGLESHWVDGGFDQFLEEDTERELRRRVVKAEREHRKERREEWAFWSTLIFGLLGLLIGLVSALTVLYSVFYLQQT